MVKSTLVIAFLVAALFVSVAGAACPPLAEECPMHSARGGCGAMAARKPDDCCPGTTSAESAPFQAQLLRPLQLSADTVERPSDFQLFLQPSPLGQPSWAAANSTDFNSLFCVLLL